ncbi:MAG TPA: hypothetical protein VHM25_16085 [Polyangiaceae bacterium]|jgi:hypothetical protein|nr:hypothetical protein [Polyangiaceae bacterium]
MRILAALVLGYFFVVGKVGAGLGADPAKPEALQAGLTTAARSDLDHALSLSLVEPPTPFDAALDTPKRAVASVSPGTRVVSLASGCRTVSKPYDLLVHFHGAPAVMEAAFEHSGIDGALVIYNLGLGSGAYEDPYSIPNSYDHMLESITLAVREMCPTAAKPKRVALSGWSAGYGAILHIIDRVKDAARVDAVLLADGMHVGFEPVGFRKVSAISMAPFTLFADEAIAGRKLFAITHSTIQTPYASTTETAEFLLDTEGLPVDRTEVAGPRPGMTRTSRADREGFHMLGFAGEDKAAHCDHLFAFGELLLTPLQERWSKK